MVVKMGDADETEEAATLGRSTVLIICASLPGVELTETMKLSLEQYQN